MSGHIFKIGVANQANPKMQNNGGQQNRDHPCLVFIFLPAIFPPAWLRVPCFTMFPDISI
jgi:hypothetical protein